MLHAPGHDVQLAGAEHHVPVVEADRQGPAQDQEQLVCVRVAVPGELPVGPDGPDVVVVHHRHGARRPRLGEGGEGGSEVHDVGHGDHHPPRTTIGHPAASSADRSPGARPRLGEYTLTPLPDASRRRLATSGRTPPASKVPARGADRANRAPHGSSPARGASTVPQASHRRRPDQEEKTCPTRGSTRRRPRPPSTRR